MYIIILIITFIIMFITILIILIQKSQLMHWKPHPLRPRFIPQRKLQLILPRLHVIMTMVYTVQNWSDYNNFWIKQLICIHCWLIIGYICYICDCRMMHGWWSGDCLTLCDGEMGYCRSKDHSKRECERACVPCCDQYKCVPEANKKCTWDKVWYDNEWVKCPWSNPVNEAFAFVTWSFHDQLPNFFVFFEISFATQYCLYLGVLFSCWV